MTEIWLQGVGSEPGPTNYRRTIKQPVGLDRIQGFLSEDQRRQLRDIYPDREAYIWGLRPGNTDQNKEHWEDLPIGATVLFSFSSLFRHAATVRLKLENQKLGEHLWEAKGESEEANFPYIYFVSEPTRIRIPASEFNQAVGYKKNYPARTLTPMREEAETRAAAYLEGILPEADAEQYSQQDFERAIADLEELGEFDTERQSKQRTEQRYIRQHWFGRQDYARCGLCGREFPVQLLVAAHVKKRALCSREEKLDYRNNTMPACSLGCDELFERGYLLVVDGIVRAHPDRPATKAVGRYLERMDGRETPIWTEESAPYFNSHQRLHGFDT